MTRGVPRKRGHSGPARSPWRLSKAASRRGCGESGFTRCGDYVCSGRRLRGFVCISPGFDVIAFAALEYQRLLQLGCHHGAVHRNNYVSGVVAGWVYWGRVGTFFFNFSIFHFLRILFFSISHQKKHENTKDFAAARYFWPPTGQETLFFMDSLVWTRMAFLYNPTQCNNFGFTWTCQLSLLF